MTAGEVLRIDLDGSELAYSVHGAGAGKPALLFVHGYIMSGTGGSYDALLNLLARHYTVYALDLRGHGGSAGTVAGWSHAALADDLAAFTRALELDRPAFVGHSFGAIVGLFAEIRHPGSFAALCLVTPGPADPTADPVAALDFFLEHGQDRDLLRQAFGHMFAYPPVEEILDKIVDAATLVSPAVHRAQQQQNSRVSIDGRLQEVSAPVLLLCGEEDHVIAPARQHDMARKLRFCKEVVFPAEGHMLPNERPAIAAREILAFLDVNRQGAMSIKADIE